MLLEQHQQYNREGNVFKCILSWRSGQAIQTASDNQRRLSSDAVLYLQVLLVKGRVWPRVSLRRTIRTIGRLRRVLI